MYWHGGWAWMMFMPVTWLALIGLIVWVAVRSTQGSTQGPTQGPTQGYSAPDHRLPQRETPEEILDRRFANGEIDGETYTDARQRLAAHRPAP